MYAYTIIYYVHTFFIVFKNKFVLYTYNNNKFGILCWSYNEIIIYNL